METPTVLARYDNRMQAEIALNLLESYGIECRMWADDLGGIGPGQSFARGVKILVDVDDMDKAREILRR